MGLKPRSATMASLLKLWVGQRENSLLLQELSEGSLYWLKPSRHWNHSKIFLAEYKPKIFTVASEFYLFLIVPHLPIQYMAPIQLHIQTLKVFNFLFSPSCMKSHRIASLDLFHLIQSKTLQLLLKSWICAENTNKNELLNIHN